MAFEGVCNNGFYSSFVEDIPFTGDCSLAEGVFVSSLSCSFIDTLRKCNVDMQILLRWSCKVA